MDYALYCKVTAFTKPVKSTYKKNVSDPLPPGAARFSLRSLLILIALAAVVMAFGRQGIVFGVIAFLLIVVGVIWVRDELRPPPALEAFSWPLYFWTGIKCTFGGSILAVAVCFLFAPIFTRMFQPTFENLFARTALHFYGWEIRPGGMQRIITYTSNGLFFATWFAIMVIIASRPRNVLARYAAPTVLAVVTAISTPEFIQSRDTEALLTFLTAMFACSIAAFLAGWLGDRHRTRRAARYHPASTA